jgi:ubiquinone/menaquinone biosynthesis C-methylase UbiE
MNKQILRIIGVFLLFDGLFTLIFGQKFVRLFRFGPQSALYRRAIEHLMNWSSWQLRVGGVIESAVGSILLNKAPLDVQTLYRNFAWFYAIIDPGWRTWFYSSAHKAFDQAISRHLPQGGYVLDLGCGIGANLSRLLGLNLPFGSYTGVDLSAEMLAEARKRFKLVPHARFLQMDLEVDPLPEGQFDLITSTWVFEHLEDPKQVVDKSCERLKPGGAMVLLFIVSTDTFISRLISRIYPFFSARLIRTDELQSFPGIQAVNRFYGPLGELVLVTLSKPTK